MPRLRPTASALSPFGQEPAVLTGMLDHPGMPCSPERLHSAREVDGETPAVLAVPGTCGEAGLQATQRLLLSERSVAVGHADRLTDSVLVSGGESDEGQRRVCTKPFVNDG